MKIGHVVVLGRNYASILGMTRAAGLVGCDVTVIRVVKEIPTTKNIKSKLKKIINGEPIDSISKYVKKYLYSIESNRDELIQLLLNEFSSSSEKILLLPTDDYTASTIDLYQDKLKKFFLFPNCNAEQGAVVSLMNKNNQKQKAISVGFKVANGWIIDIKDGKYTIPEDIEYPCFTKPEISFLGNKNCMKRCNNLFDLTEVLEKVADVSDCPILVEQYIEIEKEYGLLGFSDGVNVYIPALIDKMKTGNGAHKGVTLLGKVMPIEQYQEIKEKTTKLILESKFVGLFDIDLYSNGDIMYFNELNLRLGAFGYSIICSGVNLPGMFVKMLLRKNYKQDNVLIQQETVCLSDKVNIEDYINGYITWEQYNQIINQADKRFISLDGDELPEKAFKRFEKIVHLKHRLKKVLRRI